MPAGLIRIEGEEHSSPWPHGLHNEPLLCRAHHAAHQRHDILSAPLPEITRVKESLHNDEPLSGVLPGPVQVKEHERLLETRREFVLLLPCGPARITWPPARIRHEFALVVV